MLRATYTRYILKFKQPAGTPPGHLTGEGKWLGESLVFGTTRNIRTGRVCFISGIKCRRHAQLREKIGIYLPKYQHSHALRT